MAQSVRVAQIEQAIRQLSYDEQLWLLERLVHGLRHRPKEARPTFEGALATLAADPQMQRQLAEIAQEFGPTERDGLEQF